MQYFIAMLIVINLQMRYCSSEGFAVKIDCSNYCQIVPQTTTILFVITIYPIDLTQVEVMMVLNQR